MDIPEQLKEEIEKLTINDHSKIIEEAQSISKKYRENDGKGKKMILILKKMMLLENMKILK